MAAPTNGAGAPRARSQRPEQGSTRLFRRGAAKKTAQEGQQEHRDQPPEIDRRRRREPGRADGEGGKPKCSERRGDLVEVGHIGGSSAPTAANFTRTGAGVQPNRCGKLFVLILFSHLSSGSRARPVEGVTCGA